MIRPHAPALLSSAFAKRAPPRRVSLGRRGVSWRSVDGEDAAATPVAGPRDAQCPLPRKGSSAAPAEKETESSLGEPSALCSGRALAQTSESESASNSPAPLLGDGSIDWTDCAVAKIKADPHIMLVIHGLSPNLSPTDFYRLGSDQVSPWKRVITKVQQQRHHYTFEPLGRYHVSFANVPPALRSGTDAGPAAELEAFTVAPGSLSAIHVDRKRIDSKTWSARLSGLIARLGLEDDRPPVVLLKVHPPSLTAADVAQLIRQDGEARDLSWRVSEPLPLEVPQINKAPDIMGGIRDMVKGRFVLVFKSGTEARRFQRQWNNRAVQMHDSDRAPQNLVYASIINW
ncbi:hypothetical protein HIM_01367 [Hirsutella minnesotensis 3608]|nr:hypothetical protein HIM_01367 [Hirsutella minnesotensis 3608]